MELFFINPLEYNNEYEYLLKLRQNLILELFFYCNSEGEILTKKI